MCDTYERRRLTKHTAVDRDNKPYTSLKMFQGLPDLSDDQAIVLMPLEGALQLAVLRLALGPRVLRLGDLTFKVAMTYKGWDKGNLVAVEVL